MFGYDTTGNMYFVNTGGTGRSPGGQLHRPTRLDVQRRHVPPGNILQIGGNSNGAIVIDINGPPAVTPTQSMSSQRRWVSARCSPTARCSPPAAARSRTSSPASTTRAEIWDPATGTGTSARPASARLYHSTALLLPDASVLVAGGGAPGPQVNLNAEIYYPPYLFDSSGTFAARPPIIYLRRHSRRRRYPARGRRQTSLRITLVKTGSVTHSVNMDQRFLELPFTSSGKSVWSQLPARAAETPPGYYQVFALDATGVPSVASMLRINIDGTPNTAVDYTATIGGAGGGRSNCRVPPTRRSRACTAVTARTT